STEVTQLISALVANQAHARDLPKFHCVLDNVSGNHNGKRFTCKAYGIQVQRKDAAKLSKLLSTAFANDPPDKKFVFYKLRHQNPSAFSKAVRLQAHITANRRVIAVKGINPEDEFTYSTAFLASFPKAIAIFKTPSTFSKTTRGAPIGRYNILCDLKDFVSLAQQLHADFPAHYMEFIIDNKLPWDDENFIEPSVISNFPGKGGRNSDDTVWSGHTLSTRDTYNTNCASAFDGLDDDFDWDDAPALSSVRTPAPPPVIHGGSGTTASPMTANTTTQASYASVASGAAPSHNQYQQQPPQPPETHRVQRLEARLATQEQQMTQMESMKQQMARMESMIEKLMLQQSEGHSSPSPRRKRTK
ncbi:MAG: hypothetical protein SGILL_010549, partial [Bacillariaceae sp.]